MNQDIKKESPPASADRPENTPELSATGRGLSRGKSTKVSDDLLRKQQQDIAINKIERAAQDRGTEKLLAGVMEAPTNKILVGILRNSLASVTDALKSTANALHKDRHHPLPFVLCQSDECVCLRNIIDGSIGVIARAEKITAQRKPQDDEDEPDDEYDGDPDQLAHDPDLPSPSEVMK